MEKAILFDNGVPHQLRRLLKPHRVITTQELNWGDLQNGALLRTAQADFDVLITTDSNIEYQQVVPNYDIALIVLRAFRTSLKYLAPLAPQVLAALETIEAGQVLYIYADQKLAAKDQAKGQK